MAAKKAAPAVAGIKFPRVMVSKDRHAKLAAEAKKKGITIQELAEQKFKTAK